MSYCCCNCKDNDDNDTDNNLKVKKNLNLGFPAKVEKAVESKSYRKAIPESSNHLTRPKNKLEVSNDDETNHSQQTNSSLYSTIPDIEVNSLKEQEKAKLKIMVFQFASKVVSDGIILFYSNTDSNPIFGRFIMDKGLQMFKLDSQSLGNSPDIPLEFNMQNIQSISKEVPITSFENIKDYGYNPLYNIYIDFTNSSTTLFFFFKDAVECCNFYSCLKILCTGGCGYIGSLTVISLLEKGYKVGVLDNLCNSNRDVIDKIKQITKRDVELFEIDLLNEEAVINLFKKHEFTGVIHYAGLKAVGESVRCPLLYYKNNLTGLLNLLKAMTLANCKKLVFSSSATVYQAKQSILKECDPLCPSNPYGFTKYFIEQILQDLHKSDPSWSISILRYFNPIGAHHSGLVGELCDKPCNLLPNILLVALGKKKCLEVYGDDWDTPDGTGVRDYIHIQDLVNGHIAALNYLNSHMTSTTGIISVHNLGTGTGVSVKQMIQEFEEATKVKITYKIVERRPGDLAQVVADPTKAEHDLNWKATHTIRDACATSWNWITLNSKEKL